MAWGESYYSDALSLFTFGFIALAATPTSDKYFIGMMHGFEMVLTMIVITWFASDDSFDCGICADPKDRQLTNNVYIEMFIIVGWIIMIIDFIAYFTMLTFDRFTEF